MAVKHGVVVTSGFIQAEEECCGEDPYKLTWTPIEFTATWVDDTVRIMVIPSISQIIYNPPYTIVNWIDGSKTIVKAGENEKFDEEVGLAMAIVKKMYKSRSAFQRVVAEANRQLPKE